MYLYVHHMIETQAQQQPVIFNYYYKTNKREVRASCFDFCMGFYLIKTREYCVHILRGLAIYKSQ